MNEIEDALIRRLDARHAIAKALGRQSERNRAILVDAWRSGETYRQIGGRFGLSATRIMQIRERGFRDVRIALKEKRRPAPAPPPLIHQAPPAFDKAAFLEHMRGVIHRRNEARAAEQELTLRRKELAWQRELGHMAQFVEMATPPEPSPVYEPPAYVPPPYVPPPPPMLAADLATEALNSFMFHRKPTEGGRYDVGQRCSTVQFAMTGCPALEHVDEAMRRLAVEIPEDAVLSVMPICSDVAPSVATVCNAYVAVQALVQWHDACSGTASYRLAVTWDWS